MLQFHALVLIALGACAVAPRTSVEAELRAAMERNQVAARSVDPDAIAARYTPNGVLLEPDIAPIEGRDTIRSFIASLPGARVDVATATPETIEVFGDTAFVWGSFFERLEFPGQPTSEQRGKFVCEWKRQPSGTWPIERMYRFPITTTE